MVMQDMGVPLASNQVQYSLLYWEPVCQESFMVLEPACSQ